MADKLRQLGRLYALYAQMDLKWFMQDIKNCVIIIIADLIFNITAAAGVFMLAVRFQGVGAMSEFEVLFMLGFYTLAGGVLYVFFAGGNIHQISRRVGRGQVDHMLMQPVPLWMQIASDGFIPVTGLSQLIIGLIITGYSIARLGIIITPAFILKAVIFIVAHVGIEMGLSFLLASSAFYKPVACEEISSVGHDFLSTLGRYPLSGIPMWLMTMLVTAFPAGLMAWFPSLVLLGKVQHSAAILLPMTVAAVLIAVASLTFRKGLNHYAQYSCNRYKDLGHRS